ncbi:MAG: LysM peptidoglycan-binding domain-containing protein [Bradyrhizobiaceae bacterium]|nr:LysM peptidoglycan-binding domain-containing protein [Bradyrhizobiaceae bacterium]
MPTWLRVAGIAMLAVWLAGCGGLGFIDVTGLTSYADPSDRNAPRLPGRVFILRGIGHIWSGGMTELADELNRRGTTASAHRHGEWETLAEEAIKLYKSDPERWPIVLIGHSNGADMSINIARRLKAHNIPVALIIGYDPTRFSGDVPSNVQRFINLYQATNLLGGGQIHPARDFRGQLINVDLRNHFEIGHMNIDKSRRLQQEVIAKVLQVVAFPEGNASSQMVSIKYVVPMNAPIELWDGGLPVMLGPGQTIASLAKLYGVPAWAIKQASRISDDEDIVPGRQVVIPRHLNTLAPAGAADTSFGQTYGIAPEQQFAHQ